MGSYDLVAVVSSLPTFSFSEILLIGLAVLLVWLWCVGTLLTAVWVVSTFLNLIGGCCAKGRNSYIVKDSEEISTEESSAALEERYSGSQSVPNG